MAAKRACMAGDRRDKQRLVDAKGRSNSSRRWLERQLNDPYVAAAKDKGLRSRAAFKLIEIDDRLRLLKPGTRVVDLGAAPGGWSQIAAARVLAAEGRGRVVAVDLLDIAPIPGVTILCRDFLAADASAAVTAALGAAADIVLSDMAPASSGQPDIDHLRILNLAEAARDFCAAVLVEGGSFITKMLQGSGEREFLESLRKTFTTLKRVKPPSSRQESAEFFVVASGYRR
jgi:23S rRNA (uridine2552-2'-O)-methyltransferase